MKRFEISKYVLALIISIVISTVYLFSKGSLNKKPATTSAESIEQLRNLAIRATDASTIIQNRLQKKVMAARKQGINGKELISVARNVLYEEIGPPILLDISSYVKSDDSLFLQKFEKQNVNPAGSKYQVDGINLIAVNNINDIKELVHTPDTDFILYFDYKGKFICLTETEILSALERKLAAIVDVKDLEKVEKNIGSLSVEQLKDISNAGPGLLGILRFLEKNPTATLDDIKLLTPKQKCAFVALAKLTGNVEEFVTFLTMESIFQINRMKAKKVFAEITDLTKISDKTLQDAGSKVLVIALTDNRPKIIEVIDLFTAGDKEGAKLLLKSINKPEIYVALENISLSELKTVTAVNSRIDRLLYRYDSNQQVLGNHGRYDVLYKRGK